MPGISLSYQRRGRRYDLGGEEEQIPEPVESAQELARCKYPEKVFNALTALLSEEPEILREEAEV